MAKVKLGKWEIEEEELERQHQDAVQRGVERVRAEPQASAITYEAATQRLIIELRGLSRVCLEHRHGWLNSVGGVVR
jgi:hypothetical protein